MINPSDDEAWQWTPDPRDRWSVSARVKAARVADVRYQRLCDTLEHEPPTVWRALRRRSRERAAQTGAAAHFPSLAKIWLVGLMLTCACAGGLIAPKLGVHPVPGVAVGALLGIGLYRILRNIDYVAVAIWVGMGAALLGFALLVKKAVH
jgi:hypothetical protein